MNIYTRGKIDELIEQAAAALREDDLEQALEKMGYLSPPYQVEVIESLPAGLQVQVLLQLPREMAAGILQEMPDWEAASLAQDLNRDILASIVDEMEPDEAADLLGDLDQDFSEEVLVRLDHPEEVAGLLEFPDESAGGRMTSEFLALPEGSTVAQAIAAIREWHPHVEVVQDVFVLDEQGRLAGMVAPFDLLRAGQEHGLGEIAERDLLCVGVQTDQEEAAELMLRHGLRALPVLNNRDELAGVITYAAAMETIQEEMIEDFFQKSALGGSERERSQVMLRGDLWRVWRIRVPFLLVTMVGGLGAGLVIDVFEDALQAVTALAIFIPIVMDMGGNAGTQSSTIFARGFVAGQIKPRNFIQQLLREASIGTGMGIGLGLVVGAIAAAWQQSLEIGLLIYFALARVFMGI